MTAPLIRFQTVIMVTDASGRSTYNVKNPDQAMRQFWTLKEGDILNIKGLGHLYITKFFNEKRYVGITEIRELVIFAKNMTQPPKIRPNRSLWPDFSEFVGMQDTPEIRAYMARLERGKPMRM